MLNTDCQFTYCVGDIVASVDLPGTNMTNINNIATKKNKMQNVNSDSITVLDGTSTCLVFVFHVLSLFKEWTLIVRYPIPVRENILFVVTKWSLVVSV